ncbi:MAG: hypothetical protein K8T91_23500 [Planctomycetes bacterium]|nr:hypothetical protein [Planctomycetota bacterium]
MHDPRPPFQHSTTTAPQLPLVAIEHYMLADDRAEYPMVFYARLTLDRVPQRAAFERAVTRALARHPLLTATVTAPQGRRRWWTWDHPTQPEILWPGDTPSDAPLDLSIQSGLRINIEQLPDGARLTLEFHHACCDGLGALNFMEDILKAYAAQPSSADESQPSAEAVRRLATRGRCGVGPLRFLLRLPLELLGSLGVLEFLMHRPAAISGSAEEKPSLTLRAGEKPSLARRASVEPEGSHWPRRHSHEFTVEQSKALRKAAALDGCTLNDMLVRDLFLVVGEWIDQHTPSKRGAHVRVMVPVNLRTDTESDLSAANVVAMINLDRRPRRWHNHHRMIRVLHWEMAAVKWARLGLTFIRAIQVTHYLLGNLQLLLSKDKCQATCVLSNLGDPWRRSSLTGPDGRVVAGDIMVKQIEMLPPIRPLTSVTIGVISIAGRLTVAFHCDRRVLSDEEANELLSRYVNRLLL